MSGAGGAGGGPARTLMWEAKAAPGQADALLAWLLDASPEGLVFRSGDRVVLVVDPEPSDLPRAGVPDPPAELLARPVHAWRFDRVR